MSSTVYVIQKQVRLDKETGKLVARFDSIEKAARFGDLVYVLSPTAHPFTSETVVGEIHDKLSGFNDDDCLLLIGNPGLIAMASSIAAHYNHGRISYLYWSGSHNDYIKIDTKLY
jgi:hypothetical protein